MKLSPGLAWLITWLIQDLFVRDILIFKFAFVHNLKKIRISTILQYFTFRLLKIKLGRTECTPSGSLHVINWLKRSRERREQRGSLSLIQQRPGILFGIILPICLQVYTFHHLSAEWEQLSMSSTDLNLEQLLKTNNSLDSLNKGLPLLY